MKTESTLHLFRYLRLSDVVLCVLSMLPLNLALAQPQTSFVDCIPLLALPAMAVVRSLALKNLRARADEAKADVRWAVLVSGVEVGQLSDTEYAEFRLAVYEGWAPYGRQILNLAWGVLKGVVQMVNAFSPAVISALIYLAFFSPETLGQAFQTVQQQTTLKQFVDTGVNWLGATCVLAGLYHAYWSHAMDEQSAFVDEFRAAIDRRVRQHFELDPYGHINVAQVHRLSHT